MSHRPPRVPPLRPAVARRTLAVAVLLATITACHDDAPVGPVPRAADQPSLAVAAAAPVLTAYCNPTPITIVDAGFASSHVTVSGAGTSVRRLTVTLKNVTHTFAGDLDIVLRGPSGSAVVLTSDLGGAMDIPNATLTFDDAAPSVWPPGALAPGSAAAFRPNGTIDGDESIPGLIGPFGTTLSAFDGTNPNGTWSLLVVDDALADVGSVAGGWCVNINASADPVADAGGPYTGVEGTPVSFTGAGSSDADGDALTYAWSFGDGTTSTDAEPTHTYTRYGTYTVTLTVDDGTGWTHTATTTATIDNVPPTITSLTGPTAPIPLVSGTASAGLTVAFSDPGASTTLSVVFACGDGTATVPLVLSSTVSATCAYTAAGVYEVTATVHDGLASASAVLQYVVVFDPNGGFVAGGGWFTSTEDDCAEEVCGGATGRATFGFLSKYVAGRTTPTGNTEFQFRAGDLQFASTSYDALIVGGNRAQYWGRGTVNGATGYTFRLTAVDGQVAGADGTVDKFRIEIWQSGAGPVGTGARIYDNQWDAPQGAQLATAIEGGNISIKR